MSLFQFASSVNLVIFKVVSQLFISSVAIVANRLVIGCYSLWLHAIAMVAMVNGYT